MTYARFILVRFLEVLKDEGYLQNKSRDEITNAVHNVLVFREFQIEKREALAVSRELVHALNMDDVHKVAGAYNILQELPETAALHYNSYDEEGEIECEKEEGGEIEEGEGEEGEIVESRQTALLMVSGRAFWEEQQKGNIMTWGEWCDEEDEED